MRPNEQQLEQYEEDGYLFIPGIFDADEVQVLMSPCHVDNHIRQFKRPEWVAHRDFAAIEPLPDDTLSELVA